MHAAPGTDIAQVKANTKSIHGRGKAAEISLILLVFKPPIQDLDASLRLPRVNVLTSVLTMVNVCGSNAFILGNLADACFVCCLFLVSIAIS
ncbi:hypothetical protein Y032_0026g1492 [Ancylostoma ceylanicum]|uniref:Uncharacterized protein n=1 Tax=Ancylostoma ceylanicum TaxID=53326 RepID=A0A016UVH9_9BILA|nr:hypothetical protein Y032_0026g1492 [Ancylostoma ceylanicum]